MKLKFENLKEAKYNNIPLWVVYGCSKYWPNVLCAKVNYLEGYGYNIWGYSVWEGEPGFRTLGIPVDDFKSVINFVCSLMIKKML